MPVYFSFESDFEILIKRPFSYLKRSCAIYQGCHMKLTLDLDADYNSECPWIASFLLLR